MIGALLFGFLTGAAGVVVIVALATRYDGYFELADVFRKILFWTANSRAERRYRNRSDKYYREYLDMGYDPRTARERAATRIGSEAREAERNPG